VISSVLIDSGDIVGIEVLELEGELEPHPDKTTRIPTSEPVVDIILFLYDRESFL
jgi:hypothetical protein